MLRYYYRSKSKLNNPAYDSIAGSQNERLMNHQSLEPPLGSRARKLLEELNLPSHGIRPQYSSYLHENYTPPWITHPPRINLELSELPKSSTPPDSYVQAFHFLREDKFSDSIHIYTDGSKRSDGVGAAAICGSKRKTASLPLQASILTAELYAIEMALQLVQEQEGRRFAIFSDSRSSLTAISNIYSDHPAVRKIIGQLNRLQRDGKQVNLVWIPSHVGISDNESVDKIAGETTRRPPEFIPIFFRDFYPYIRLMIFRKWEVVWKDSRQKMVEIKDNIESFNPLSNPSRATETRINRLRTGHSRFSHGYMMENPRIVPVCPFCCSHSLSVKHIIIQCEALASVRQQELPSDTEINMESVLGSNCNPMQIMSFMNRVGLWSEI